MTRGTGLLQKLRIVLLLGTALSTVGCQRTPLAPAEFKLPEDSRADNVFVEGFQVGEGRDGLHVGFGTWGNALVFAVVSDVPGDQSSAGLIQSSNFVQYRGLHGKLGEVHVKWACATSDGQTGRMFINGNEYDLAQGSLLLVSTTGGSTRALQLQRDLSKLSPEAASLEPWLKADPQIETFFVARAGDQENP